MRSGLKTSLTALAALIGVATASGAWADMTNVNYVSGKTAYANDKYADAARLLRAYQTADAAYLAANPKVSAAIVEAIRYCDRKTTHAFIAQGLVRSSAASTEPPPPKPDLP